MHDGPGGHCCNLSSWHDAVERAAARYVLHPDPMVAASSIE
jgi:hypothetical protein